MDEVAADCVAGADATGDVFGVICSGATAKKRIDEVIELLDLTSSKTVHIDAFEPRESPYHGYSKEMTTEVMRKIFRYWRDKGIDVTSEFYKGYQRTDAFYGLQPAAWYSDLTAEERCTISPEL